MSSAAMVLTCVSLGLISFATLLNIILLKRKPNNFTFQKVAVIIKSWWLIITFFLITLATAPLGLLLGFSALSVLCVFEYFKHSRLDGLKKPIATLVIIATLLQYWCLYYQNWSLYFALPVVFMFLGFATLLIISGDAIRFPEIFSSYAGLILAFHLLSYLPSLYLYNKFYTSIDQSLYFLFFVIFLTELNDILQFLFGKAFGKNKWAPLISPNKTDAGFIGGVLTTTALGSFVFHYITDFTLLKSAVIAFIIAITGILGDLTFSAIKRYFGTKDFSDALPGHGGVLDRLDSLIYTTPSVFYFLYFTQNL